MVVGSFRSAWAKVVRTALALGLGSSAIKDRLLAVLRGVGPIGLGVEPVQRSLGTLCTGLFTAGGGPSEGFYQRQAVRGTCIPITPRPVTVDRSPTSVRCRILHRRHARQPITLVGSRVARPGGRVPHIGSQVAGIRGPQQPADLGLQLGVSAIRVSGVRVALVSEAVPAIRRRVPLCRQVVTLVRAAQMFPPAPVKLGPARPSFIVPGVVQVVHPLPSIRGLTSDPDDVTSLSISRSPSGEPHQCALRCLGGAAAGTRRV